MSVQFVPKRGIRSFEPVFSEGLFEVGRVTDEAL
jgi:hypothetical protein